MAALAERERELAGAREQQTATAEVLKVIGRSVSDAAPVLETILKAGQPLFGSEEIGIYTVGDDDMVRVAAWRGPSAEEAGHDVTPLAESVTGRIIRDRRIHHIPDLLAEPDLSPLVRERAQRLGSASLLYAPMLWEDRGLGSILVVRSPPRPFTEREHELLQSFANQAAIAIQNARLFNETKEALERQTATANVLKVISQSVSDAAPVFEAILESCQRLFGLEAVAVYLVDGDVVQGVAQRGWDSGDWGKDAMPLAESSTGLAIAERRAIHIPDLAEKPGLSERFIAPLRETGGMSVLYAPMLWKDRGVGSIVVSRRPAKPFVEKEIALLQSFADQAAIAIQNARLFEAVQAKTRDLEEALQQQTATADVLKVISRSVFDLQTVLDTLAESAYVLCGAGAALLYLRSGDAFECKAIAGAGAEDVGHLFKGRPIRAGRTTAAERVIMTGDVHSITDLFDDPDVDPKVTAGLRGAGLDFRSTLAVPMKRDGAVVGVLVIARAKTGSFPQRQVDLLQTFADQAVIAIENVRLFDEVQARTRDLSEALEQQTATADVLKAISRTAFDLDTVLETLISTAVRLCNATRGGQIFRRHGEVYRYAASRMDVDPAYLRHEQTTEINPGRGTLIGRVALENRVVHIVDAWNDPEYAEKEEARLGSVRAMLGVPLMRNGEPVGAFALGRAEPVPFTQRQIDLVTTFADQAVIAIENVRLFDEVQARTRDLSEALQMQTATSDVLKVISRSAFDLQAVFNTLVSSAVELGGALTGTICVREGDVFRYRDTIGAEHTSALAQYLREHPATPGRSTIAGRVLLSGKVERIPDCLADPDYVVPMGSLATNVRSLLGVPLLRKDGVEGAIILTRDEPGHFSDRQVEIVQTFADQAVIALENVRLFDEVQARTRELAASLDDLRKAQDRLVQSEKLASLGQLTAGIAHEIKNPLNFVNNFSALTRELVGELDETLKRAPLEKAEREEADELIGTIGANLDKVVSHGKRADSIVKNMLLHSREGSGERTSVNVNAMVEEALNLAYHGARAEKPGFNVTIARSLDDKAGVAELYAQEMTRVLLNLISNGFYATAKRKQGEGNGSYEPTVTASTRDLGHSVEIAIRDNGTGIPDQVKAKMFNPFFTTKPAGEGTGLGLSLSHDIVVKQHGGTIEVSTEPGSFTQFTIVLPRAGAAA